MDWRAQAAAWKPRLVPRRRLWLALAGALALYALLGFAAVPWLVKRQLPGLVAGSLAATASVERVRFDPFSLAAELHGFALADAAGQEVARFDLLRVNVQLSSLVRRALVLRELRLDGLHARAVRAADGALNLAQLVPPAPEAAPAPAEAERAGLFPVVVESLSLNGAQVDVRDEQRPEPFETRIGPLDVAVSHFSTRPDEPGRQQVQVTLAEGATLGWRGSLQLEPLRSEGFVEARGSHLALAKRYLGSQLPVALEGGDLELSLSYRVEAKPGGEIVAAVSGLSFGLFDLRLATQSGREFLRLPSLQLRGGSLRWPGKAVGVASIVVSGLGVDAVREADGSIDLASAFGSAPASEGEAPPSETPAPAADEPGDPLGGWDVHVGELRLDELHAALEDRSVTPPATLAVSDLDVSVRNLSGRAKQKAPFLASATLASGGRVGARGDITVLPAVDVTADVRVDDLALAVAQPYVAQQARVEIGGGRIGLGGSLVSNPQETLGFRGHFALDGLELRDVVRSERLAAIGRLEVADLSLSLAESSLQMLQVVVTRPYARVAIAKDKTTNVGAVMIEQPETPAPEPPRAETQPEPERPFAVRVAQVRVEDGGADFSDLSLPLPFAAKIHRLRGTLGPVATQTRSSTRLKLDGQVGAYGLMQLAGSTRIDDALDATRLKLQFRNVDMPTFTGYSAEFAGRRIASGKLDLDLGYDIVGRKLTASNHLVLSDFRLGERVESPNAVNLPLDLALALLRDAEGRIDVDLPVTGDVDDPEFGYGKVIWEALKTLVIKIAAAPFRALAALVGASSEDFGTIEFEPGRAELLPPAREQVAKLIEVLSKRPQLVLEAPAAVDPEADTAVLQDDAVNARIVAELGGDEPTTDHVRDVLEDFWDDAYPDGDRDDVEERFERDGELDEVAFLVELRRQVAQKEPLAPGALDALAGQRAAATVAAVTADGRIPAARAVAKPRKDVEAKDGWVPLALDVSASGASATP